MLFTFGLFVDVIGDIDDDDVDEVDDADERGGEVVVVGIRVVDDGDLVLGILAGGGARPGPKIEAGNSSFGPKFGFKMLSIEKGSARLAANWWLLLLLLMGEVTGLGRRGWVSMG